MISFFDIFYLVELQMTPLVRRKISLHTLGALVQLPVRINKEISQMFSSCFSLRNHHSYSLSPTMPPLSSSQKGVTSFPITGYIHSFIIKLLLFLHFVVRDENFPASTLVTGARRGALPSTVLMG